MSITFYYAPMSSATRVHWALQELGVPYEAHRVSLQAGEQHKPEYLAINPNGKVPALVDDGANLFESLAILIHLGEKYGVAKGLWPKEGTTERAEALTWIVWGTVALHANSYQAAYPKLDYIPAELKNKAIADHARGEAEKLFKILDTRLEDRDYILKSGFTLVDVANAAVVQFASRADINIGKYPRVAAWLERCQTRPALAAVIKG